MTEHFNLIGLWVATQIVVEESPKQQAKVLTKFVQIAERLLLLRNYNSCVEILSGLSNVSVRRLKRLEKHLDPKIISRLQVLSDYFDPVSGYANYRKLSFKFPCLQLYAVALRTLALVEEGNPHFLGEDKTTICFSRMTMIAECLETLKLYHADATQYPFKVKPEITTYLRNIHPLTEEQLYELSIKHEPLRNKGNLSLATEDVKQETTVSNPLFGKELPQPLSPRKKEYIPDESSNSKKRRHTLVRRTSGLFGKVILKQESNGS